MSDTSKFQSVEANPDNPFVIMHELFTTEVARSVLSAEDITVYRDLSNEMKMQALIGGTLTGLIAICRSKIAEDKDDELVAFIKSSIDAANMNATGLLEQWKKAVEQLGPGLGLRH